MDKILIVDDNPAVCIALELLLSIHDMSAVSCHTPKEAYTMVQREPIALVIQDMNFT